MRLEGIHHITAITADAPRNVDFYARALGLRLVKKTVNQDDPTVYHLFYADEHGSPGNDLTPEAPDLTDKQWKHGSTDGEIFSSIKNGIGPEFNMGAFGDQLKDEDVWKVVNYLRSLAKK